MSTSNNNTSSTSNNNTNLNVTTLTTTNNITLVTTNNTTSTTTTLNATQPTPVTWNEQEIRQLIDQRKHRNTEYHQIIGRSKKSFWDSVARRINRAVGSHFSGRNCRRKFQNLVSAYYVSKNVIM
jgi:hypothetical protein